VGQIVGRSCAKVHEPSELRFGVVRGVGRCIGGDAACSVITLGNLVKFVQLTDSSVEFTAYREG